MQLGELSSPQAREQVGKVVVVPLGALEQHGRHLPMLTDCLIGSEVVRRAEADLGEEALFLPMLYVGASDHHRGFPGTVSLSNATYVRVLVDILESLIGGGFRRILLLNAHGGNITPGRMAIYEVQERHRAKLPDLWLAFTSWFEIAKEPSTHIEGLVQPAVNHACEWETSVIQVLRPELVNEDAVEGTRIPFDSPFYSPDWTRPSRVDVSRMFEQLSNVGAFGYPEAATPEKGEALLTIAAREVAAFVRDFATWPASLAPE